MKQLSFTARVYVGDSDDSDTEGGLGNVERVVMRPPGHSGKAKQGHLCFDASFETGNLGRVDFITENEYDLFTRPDTCNPRIRFWFHFSVENVQRDQRVIFNIVNLSKVRNLFQRGMTPVVRSSRRRQWQRLPGHQVYYYRSPEHGSNHVLSFAFAFDGSERGEKYFFALTFPYSYSRCMAFLKKMKDRRPERIVVDTVARSVQERDVPVVFVEERDQLKQEEMERCVSPDSGDDEDSRGDQEEGEGREEGNQVEEEAEGEEGERREMKPTVIIIARSHPGDSNTSFIAQGMIEFITSDHTIAKELRAKVNFILFPMVNPDGVFLGNARSSLLGVDFNRSWHKLGASFPELHGVREFILRSSKERRLDFVLDLHANVCIPGLWIQGNSFDSVYRFERHIVFPKMLALNCPDFEADNAMYNADVEKEGTCRRFISVNTNDPTGAPSASGTYTNTYSVEISVFGYTADCTSATSAEIFPYSEEDYLMHGRRICRTLWEYYKVTGTIDSKFQQPQQQQQQSPPEPSPDAAGFSMLRLRNIAKQRDIFSSLESLTSDEERQNGVGVDDDDNDGKQEDGVGERSRSRRKVRLPSAAELVAVIHDDDGGRRKGEEEEGSGDALRQRKESLTQEELLTLRSSRRSRPSIFGREQARKHGIGSGMVVRGQNITPKQVVGAAAAAAAAAGGRRSASEEEGEADGEGDNGKEEEEDDDDDLGDHKRLAAGPPPFLGISLDPSSTRLFSSSPLSNGAVIPASAPSFPAASFAAAAAALAAAPSALTVRSISPSRLSTAAPPPPPPLSSRSGVARRRSTRLRRKTDPGPRTVKNGDDGRSAVETVLE